ncbi:type VI secretion system Vgr family domain protein [Salmonella enterica]|nr:type VI secretion system Vgr family domain protein [Salmonella enterica]
MPQTGTRFTAETDGFDAQMFAVVGFHLVQSYSSRFTLGLHVVSGSTGLKATDLLEQNITLTVLKIC